jgi:hypothetical protein
MWPLLVNVILIVSVVLGIPALVALLWSWLRWRREQSPFQKTVAQLSKTLLLVFGAVAVLAGVFIPLAISQKAPVRDEALIRIAPQFARPEFTLVYTATFGANADFRVEYLPKGPKPERVCLTLSQRGEGGFAGWMIILWSQFFFKFFENLGYPATGRDLSQYQTLSFEIRGTTGGETIEIAIKDKTDYHREERHIITLPEGSSEWQLVELSLASTFAGVDFTKIETISFAMNREQRVCIRNIMLK